MTSDSSSFSVDSSRPDSLTSVDLVKSLEQELALCKSAKEKEIQVLEDEIVLMMSHLKQVQAELQYYFHISQEQEELLSENTQMTKKMIHLISSQVNHSY